MTNRCDCGARQGDPHLPACHPADRSDYDANIPAVADAARAMLAALIDVMNGMIAANIAEATHPKLREGCHAARKAIRQANAAGITP